VGGGGYAPLWQLGGLLGVDDILLTRALTAQGYDPDELARLLRRGELTRIRRGAYLRPSDPETAESRDQKRRRVVMATLPQLDRRAVASHGSAALLHHLPTWPTATDRVHVTRDRRGGSRRRSLVQVHGAPLTSTDVVVIDGLAVTSLSRTVLDLARTLPWEQAVAAGDRALAHGLTRAELADGLDRMRGWPGLRAARRTVDFLDVRSESAGESVSRVRIHEAGLPPPIPQLKVFDDDGRFVARVDFGWEEKKTIGEFDGKGKYGELLNPGQTPGDAVVAEKRRENLLRDLGWQVVRWLWADLYKGDVIKDRLLRAFARAV
jgi:Transcriptional regulator, AbiEi antitoxin